MTHIINRLQLEVTCPDEDMSFHLRQNFAQTFQTEIAAVIDSICSALVSDAESIKIDRIELDLGSFSRYSFNSEFIKVFGAKFKQQLDSRLSEIAPVKRQASRQLSNTETLLYFLENGTLPWFADDAAIDINELCKDALTTQPTVVAQFLNHNSSNEKTWNRVAWQLSSESKKMIITLIAGFEKPGEIFDNWVKQLSEQVPGLQANSLYAAFEDIDDLLLENAPTVRADNAEITVLKKIFETHIDIVFKTDKELNAALNIEFEKLTTIAQQTQLVPTEFEINKKVALLDNVTSEEKDSFSQLEDIFSNTQTDDFGNVPEKLMVKNAGLVLLAPFLNAFFKELNLLDSDGWKDRECSFRAVHLLKYLSNGQLQAPEYALVIEKLLCGLPIDMPIPLNIVLTEQEKDEATSLLKAVITHWSALKNTSVDGLREAFFKRDGLLMQKENNWLLQVERKTLDVLLDSIPWGFSTLSLSWARYLVFVEW